MLTIKQKFLKLSNLTKKCVIIKNKNDLLQDIYRDKINKKEKDEFINWDIEEVSILVDNL